MKAIVEIRVSDVEIRFSLVYGSGVWSGETWQLHAELVYVSMGPLPELFFDCGESIVVFRPGHPIMVSRNP